MPELYSCARCGATIIIDTTTINSDGDITHQGNEFVQLPDLCKQCERQLSEEIARHVEVLAKEGQ